MIKCRPLDSFWNSRYVPICGADGFYNESCTWGQVWMLCGFDACPPLSLHSLDTWAVVSLMFFWWVTWCLSSSLIHVQVEVTSDALPKSPYSSHPQRVFYVFHSNLHITLRRAEVSPCHTEDPPDPSFFLTLFLRVCPFTISDSFLIRILGIFHPL